MSTVLFACVHNAGRSQMAEAIFNQRAQGRHRAISAGTEPAEAVHPQVVAAMLQLGIDLSGARPRLLTADLADEADVAISMGCDVAAACPALRIPMRDWALADPAGMSLAQVRDIRDDIDRRVTELLTELR